MLSLLIDNLYIMDEETEAQSGCVDFPGTYSEFIKQMFIQHLLHVRHCFRPCRHIPEPAAKKISVLIKLIFWYLFVCVCA